MTTLAPAAPSARGAGPARAWRSLARTEGRLFLRDRGSVFFALIFPSVLVVGVGFAIPGMRDVMTGVPARWAGLRPVDVYVPVTLAAAIAGPALTTLPVTMATYREQGVFRRLSTTPMRPRAVLTAHVAINIAALLLAAVLALLVAAAVFGPPAPVQVGVAAAAFVLGAASMFGLGLLVAGRARKGSAASSLGMLLHLPMLFLAGMWTPGPAMPGVVGEIAAYTPLGAASQAMTEAWFGTGVPVLQLVAMVAWVVVLYPLAARLFRWA